MTREELEVRMSSHELTEWMAEDLLRHQEEQLAQARQKAEAMARKGR